jgi:hypothetical protein
MKQFIKESLRLQLENLLYEVREDFKELFFKIRTKITRIHSDEELDKLSNDAKLLSQKNPNKIGSINDGTKYYKFKFTILPTGKGCKIESIGTSGIDDRELGISQDGKILTLQARAYSDQVNPEDSSKTIYTPIVVAKIKILADDESIKIIKRFIKGGDSYTADDQLSANAKASTEKTAPEDMYRFKKLGRRNARKGVLSINEPDATESNEYKEAVRKYQNLLPLYKEKTKKGEDVEPLKTRLDDLKAIIDKINPNYGK